MRVAKKVTVNNDSTELYAGSVFGAVWFISSRALPRDEVHRAETRSGRHLCLTKSQTKVYSRGCMNECVNLSRSISSCHPFIHLHAAIWNSLDFRV